MDTDMWEACHSRFRVTPRGPRPVHPSPRPFQPMHAFCCAPLFPVLFRVSLFDFFLLLLLTFVKAQTKSWYTVRETILES